MHKVANEFRGKFSTAAKEGNECRITRIISTEISGVEAACGTMERGVAANLTARIQCNESVSFGFGLCLLFLAILHFILKVSSLFNERYKLIILKSKI